MPYELQETYGVLGLEKIVIIKLVTIIQNPGNPVRRYVESPCVRSATNENKIAVTQVYFQFLGVKPYRKQTIEFFSCNNRGSHENIFLLLHSTCG